MLQFSETGKSTIYGNMNLMMEKGMIMARVGCENTAKEFVKKAKQNLERMTETPEKPDTSLQEGIGYKETAKGYILYSQPKGNSLPAAVEYGRGSLSKPASEGPLYFRQYTGDDAFAQTAKPTRPRPYFAAALREVTDSFKKNIGNNLSTVL